MLPPITNSVAECIGSTPMVKLTPQNKGESYSFVFLNLGYA